MVWSLKVCHVPVFVFAAVLCLVLPRLPVVGKFFRVINTALHEFGHALFTLLLAGRVERIDLFNDTSGLTTYRSPGRLSVFLVALAGYPSAAFGAYAGFCLLSAGAGRVFVIGLTLLFAVMLLFWVRNAYGIVWSVLFCLVNFLLLSYGGETCVDLAALFYATSVLAESVSAAFGLFVRSVRMPKQAGDAADLARLTHMPAWVWSLLFAVCTGWVTCRVIRMVFFQG